MLDPELNTKPRTQYLIKLRNPSGKLDEELYKVEGEETPAIRPATAKATAETAPATEVAH